jgi:shikimate kinase
MGAGKTTIGRHLAKRLKRPFWDSDKELENRTGVDIPTIFDYEGEEGFRARESAVLEELCLRSGIVLATGGGAVLREKNRKLLMGNGMVVYLRVSIETQLARTSRDRSRPLLQTENPRIRLEQLKKQRDPLYLEVSDLVMDTDYYSVSIITSRIVKRIGSRIS